MNKELKRKGKLTKSHLQTYEQFIETYKQYRAEKAKASATASTEEELHHDSK
ncbi:hypothetical protein QA612_19590 [Evansella sp. AB-P1]|uniref:hypothetical protein n=1 Tax=Evansella sp. AB-P1 TaxID=3037653 RepID=UPI00241DF57C|nr:hypothetical protein [Evansella sp. AB-P1]MDG5789664.1 hypothetical protein [Evansella sp. AB-P1]